MYGHALMQAWDEEMRDAVSSKQWGTVLVVVDIGVTKVGKACSVDTRYQVWKVADPAEPAGRWMNLVVYGFVLGPHLTFKDIRVGDVFTITGASVNCKVRPLQSDEGAQRVWRHKSC